MAEFAKRKPKDDSADLPPTLVRDNVFIKACPALWEYLTLSRWEDGATRRTATLLVMVDEGTLKACLNDRDAERSLWVTGGTFQGLLAAIEERLKEGTGEWRKNQAWNGRGGKKH